MGLPNLGGRNPPIYRAARQLLSFEVTQQIKRLKAAEEIYTPLEHARSKWETRLPLGVYHHLLPGPLRTRAVIEQFNIPRFLDTVNRLTI